MGLLAIRFQFRHDLTQTLLREYDIMHGKDGERVLLRTPKKNRRSSVCAGRKRPTTHAGGLPAEWVCARYALNTNGATYAPGMRQVSLFLSAQHRRY